MAPGTTTTFDRSTAWFRGLDPWLLDAVIGTVFTVLSVVGLFTTGDSGAGYAEPGAVATLLALGCSLPFYFRRRAPLASTLVAATSLVLLSTLEYPSGVQSQLLLVAVYSLGSHESGARRLFGFLWVEVGVIVVASVGIPDSTTANVLLAGAFYAAAYFFGSAMRNRRLYQEQLEERAEILAREHEEAAKRAVADERLRIAQELHDVVAHSMGVIAVQAGVGAHVIDADPAEAKRSLEAIATTSRTTLTEIRRLLGVLRADGDADYAPAPGLADLHRLVADIEAAGVEVDLRVAGSPQTLPPGIDLTAYRIVQEALTNVLKHAGPAHATVTIGYEPGAVSLEVVDDGHGTNGAGRADGHAVGHGITGMRERVGVYGGALEVGPRLGGGFRVAARLPLGDDA